MKRRKKKMVLIFHKRTIIWDALLDTTMHMRVVVVLSDTTTTLILKLHVHCLWCCSTYYLNVDFFTASMGKVMKCGGTNAISA